MLHSHLQTFFIVYLTFGTTRISFIASFIAPWSKEIVSLVSLLLIVWLGRSLAGQSRSSGVGDCINLANRFVMPTLRFQYARILAWLQTWFQSYFQNAGTMEQDRIRSAPTSAAESVPSWTTQATSSPVGMPMPIPRQRHRGRQRSSNHPWGIHC